jgi:undecaprenyl-diphosphatase
MEWLESLVLGIVQGITEFLPVSSDGHLLLAQNIFAWLTGQARSGKENLFFDVILHLGTTAAIIVYHRRLIAEGWRGLLGAENASPGLGRPEVIRVGLLAIVATSPLVPFALFFKKALDRAFEGTTVAGFGFLITAAVLLTTAWLRRRDGAKGPGETTWVDALLIGVAQMFAPLPGVSRSGLTIAAGLALGLSRRWSVGFSLLIAVPAILGAACYEVAKAFFGREAIDTVNLTTDRVAQASAATILAGVVGYFAIIWLTKIVRSGRIWCFSVYLVVLAIVVLTTGAIGRRPVPKPVGVHGASARGRSTATPYFYEVASCRPGHLIADLEG